MHLALIDWAIVFVYAVVVVTIGLRAARRAGSSEGYFLANRQLRWPFIGASLFASNISAEHFVGLAGSGFAMGLAVGGFEWMAVFCLVPLIVLFLPFYMRNRIYTVPEFLEKRFSPGVRLLFSGLMVVLSVLTKISISLWASSIVFSEVLGWNKLAVIWAVGLFTALYTMKGGLSAVVYTDALQTAVLLLSAVVLTRSDCRTSAVGRACTRAFPPRCSRWSNPPPIPMCRGPACSSAYSSWGASTGRWTRSWCSASSRPAT